MPAQRRGRSSRCRKVPVPVTMACGIRGSRSRRGGRRTESAEESLAKAPIPQDLAGGIMPRRARDSSARMRASATHVEPGNRPAITAMAQSRPRGPKLIERHVTVNDVTADQPEFALEILGAVDL